VLANSKLGLGCHGYVISGCCHGVRLVIGPVFMWVMLLSISTHVALHFVIHMPSKILIWSVECDHCFCVYIYIYTICGIDVLSFVYYKNQCNTKTSMATDQYDSFYGNHKDIWFFFSNFKHMCCIGEWGTFSIYTNQNRKRTAAEPVYSDHSKDEWSAF